MTKHTPTPLLSASVDFKTINDLHGSTIGRKSWEVDNGGRVVTERKVTIRNGLITTKYLHLWITQPNGRTFYYKEQKDGSFKGAYYNG